MNPQIRVSRPTLCRQRFPGREGGRQNISLCNRQPCCRWFWGQYFDRNLRWKQVLELSLKISFDQMVQCAAAAASDENLLDAVQRCDLGDKFGGRVARVVSGNNGHADIVPECKKIAEHHLSG